jgi:hypothetical protein
MKKMETKKQIETHGTFLGKLNVAMRDDFLAVNLKKNPVALSIKEASTEELLYVLGQYCIFPNNIVSFLGTVKDTVSKYDLKLLAREIARNIGEEEGAETDGIPHYDMLISGASKELGFTDPIKAEVALKELKASPAMATFISSMQTLVASKDPLFATGVVYALESSAVPELVIVKALLNEVHMRVHEKPLSEETTLGKFMALHLGVWEPGHEEGIRDTTKDLVKTDEEKSRFEAGFRTTLGVMDSLWKGLHIESRDETMKVEFGV